MVNAAASGTVTFEALFDIDSYNITGTANDGSMGNVTGGGNTTGSNSVTLTANATAQCARFDHWEDKAGNTIPGDDDYPNKLTVTPLATWVHGTTYEYKAVFVPKTVTITVTTAGNGTVRIVTPAANN